MAATLEIHFLTLKYTHCQFCQNYPKKVAKIKLILAKLAFATNYEVCFTVYKDHNYKAVQCGSNKTGSELYSKAHIKSTIFCHVT